MTNISCCRKTLKSTSAPRSGHADSSGFMCFYLTWHHGKMTWRDFTGNTFPTVETVSELC